MGFDQDLASSSRGSPLNIFPKPIAVYPLFTNNWGRVTTSGKVSRKKFRLCQTRVLSGKRPVNKEALDGPQTACWA